MRRIQWTLLLMVAAILLLGGAATAQSPPFVYTILRNKHANSVTSTNVETGETRVLATFPRRSTLFIRDIFPYRELMRFRNFLVYTDGLPFYMADHVSNIRLADVQTRQIVVSPDGTQIALMVEYTANRRFHDYFGVAQVVTISTQTGEQTVTFEIALGDAQFEPSRYVFEQRITDVEWLADGEALLVAINPNFRRSADNLVIVPLNGDAPTRIGSADAWAVSPDSNQIVTLTGENNPGRIVRFYEVGANTQQIAQFRLLRTWIASHQASIAYINDYALFSSATFFDPPQWLYSMINRSNPVDIVFSPQDSFGSIHTTDGNSVILQTTNALYRLLLTGKNIYTVPITDEDDVVLDWAISTAGNVVVRLKRNPQQLQIAGEEAVYALIDPNHHLPPDVHGEIIDFDW